MPPRLRFVMHLWCPILVLLICLLLAAGEGVAREPLGGGNQTSGEAPPSDDGHEAAGSKFAEDLDSVAICYRGKAAFVVASPSGWINDEETARHYELCAMYMPVGGTFEDAPAVMYPKVGARRGSTLKEAADAQAEDARRYLDSKSEGKGPQVREGETWRSEAGQEIAVRLFDNGPAPNEWEAVAYMTHNDGILMLVLAAREKETRDAYLPRLEEAARKVIAMDLQLQEKPVETPEAGAPVN